jgi:DNA-binding GntR family transcriptional regulator
MSSRSTPWGIYKTIADMLRIRILGGEFRLGELLPSEAALVTEYHVARNTVRRALDQLTTERLIATRPGRGRVVLTSPGQEDATPRYRQIAADLRTELGVGVLKPGDMLPSEASLMVRYGASRGTVRQALSELDGGGFVKSCQGKGRFVLGR